MSKDAKRKIRSRKVKDIQYNGKTKWKREKNDPRKQKIEQQFIQSHYRQFTMFQSKHLSIGPHHCLLSSVRCIICKLVHVMNIVNTVQLMLNNQSINVVLRLRYTT